MQILGGRPLGIRIGWTGGGGHFLSSAVTTLVIPTTCASTSAIRSSVARACRRPPSRPRTSPVERGRRATRPHHEGVMLMPLHSPRAQTTARPLSEHGCAASSGGRGCAVAAALPRSEPGATRGAALRVRDRHRQSCRLSWPRGGVRERHSLLGNGRERPGGSDRTVPRSRRGHRAADEHQRRPLRRRHRCRGRCGAASAYRLGTRGAVAALRCLRWRCGYSPTRRASRSCTRSSRRLAFCRPVAATPRTSSSPPRDRPRSPWSSRMEPGREVNGGGRARRPLADVVGCRAAEAHGVTLGAAWPHMPAATITGLGVRPIFPRRVGRAGLEARTTAWTRSRRPSLVRMRVRWVRTVLSSTNSSAAISRLDSPRAIWRSTASSRAAIECTAGSSS